jgi:hexosaminidase
MRTDTLMHRLAASLALILLGAASGAVAADAVSPLYTAPLTLIPAPLHAERQASVFILNDGDNLDVQAGDPQAFQIAGYFAALTAKTRGLKLRVPAAVHGASRLAKMDQDKHLEPPSTSQAEAPITFALSKADAATLGVEGYRLRVDPSGAHVTAGAPAGLFYGAVTLWQLMQPYGGHGKTAILPNADIEDRPRYAWRGLLLDSARHYQDVADIERLIDWMALHKLNVLQWHLTDDQGWRLEIKKYPKLTSIGGCRKAVGPDAVLTGGTGKPYCGFYTQQQAREIVAYGAARYITVVPEIEMPGHAQAVIAAYPEFGATGSRPHVSTDWGVHPYLYNVDDRTLGFLEDVLDEVMAVFPSSYIAVGGDEALKDQWKASAAVQARMHTLNIGDEDGLQGWFITRIGSYLHDHGRKLIGWDGILVPGLPSDAAVMVWQSPDLTAQALKQQHDVVIAYSPTLYLDDYQSDGHDEPPGRPPVVSLKDVYDFDPQEPGADASPAAHILGEQINLWTEYMPTFARDEHAIFPRMAAFAEAAWSPASARDWQDFLARLPAQFARYRALGIGYADSAFAPRFALKPKADGKIDVTLSTQAGGVIRYSTGDAAPTSSSPLYKDPLSLTPPVRLTAATFADDGSLLAAPRMRDISAAELASRNSDDLSTCSNKLVLRIEGPRPLAGPRPVYRVDIMDTCWRWPAAALEGMHHLVVSIGDMPWNYQLAHDVTGVVVRPMHDGRPTLDVHLDGCDGRSLAQLPLHADTAAGHEIKLTAALPVLTGNHELCFIVTGDPKQRLWAIDEVRLSP